MSGTRWTTLLAAALLGVCTLGACGEERAAVEGRKLLEAVDAIAEEGPIGPRREQVERLARLPLSTPALRATRQACLEAHRALLEAEEAQDRARDIVEAARPSDAPFGPRERAEAERWLARADEAIARSKKAAPRCEEGVARLRLKRRP